MINLLPPVYGDRIRYGRSNTVLRRWLVAMLAATAGLLLITLSGWLYIDQQSKNLQNDISNSKQQLQEQDLDKVQENAEEISGDIKIINQVLRQEIRFSDLIQDIGKIMPSGTVLGSLTLSKAIGSIDLSAKTRNYTTAAQIAVNLNDPKNMLFDKVDVVNISCSSTSDSTSGDYKCSASFKALFSKEAQNRYLNVAKETKP